MNNWEVEKEVYQIEVYDTPESEKYTEIEIESKVYAFKIAEELLFAGKSIRVRKETYYV